MAKPLTKTDRYGNPYVRPRNIEAAIDLALGHDVGTLSKRVQIGDPGSPDHLQSECLVHLIRDAGRRGDSATMNALLPGLLRRCEASLLASVPSNLPSDTVETILSEFAELFVEDASGGNLDELDYYEIRFNSALSALRIDFLRKQTKQLRREVALPEADAEDETNEDALARLAGAFHSPNQEQVLSNERLLDLLEILTQEERKAVILCHIMGFEEESKDPNKITAATLCGCSGRTIRNRLKRVAKKIIDFLKEDE